MTDARATAVCKREHRTRAVALAAAFIILATLAGGFAIGRAINVFGPTSAAPITPVTSEAIERSVARLVAGRLAPERLKVLVGLFDETPAAAGPQANLMKVEHERRLLTPNTGAGSYLVGAVANRGQELSHDLARLVDSVELNDLRRRAPAQHITSLQYHASVESLVLLKLDPAQGEAVRIVKDWTDELEQDPGISRAWKLIPSTTDTFAALISDALSTEHLPRDIAKQIATDHYLSLRASVELERSANDLAGRLVWGITAVLFIGLWAAVATVSVWQIWTLLPSRRERLAATSATIGTAVALGLIGARWSAVAVDQLAVFGPLLSAHEKDLGTHIAAAARILTGMATASGALLLTAVWTVAREDSADILEMQLDGLRTLFNTSAAMLVAGAVQVAVLYGWIAAAIEDPDASRALGSAAMLAAGFVGALSSVILMAIYLPTVSVLRKRALTGYSAESQAALTSQGLDGSSYQQLLRLLQALAPLLVAVLLAGLLTLVNRT